MIDRKSDHLEQVAADFDRLAPLYDQLPSARSHDELLMSFAPLNRSAKVLEVGCGTGALLAKLAQKGHVVKGCDISSAMLSRAGLRLGELNGILLNCPAEQINERLGEERFDVIIAERVLHHCLEPKEVVLDLYHLLTPGGILLILDLLSTGPRSIRQRGLHTLARISFLLKASLTGDFREQLGIIDREREVMSSEAWRQHLRHEPSFNLRRLRNELGAKNLSPSYRALSPRFGLVILRREELWSSRSEKSRGRRD